MLVTLLLSPSLEVEIRKETLVQNQLRKTTRLHDTVAQRRKVSHPQKERSLGKRGPRREIKKEWLVEAHIVPSPRESHQEIIKGNLAEALTVPSLRESHQEIIKGNLAEAQTVQNQNMNLNILAQQPKIINQVPTTLKVQDQEAHENIAHIPVQSTKVTRSRNPPQNQQSLRTLSL